MDNSCFAMGQSAGGVHEVKPVAAIVADIMRDAEAAIDRMAGLKVKETA
jgi:enoyl-[acyl-carrier protein] reductase II